MRIGVVGPWYTCQAQAEIGHKPQAHTGGFVHDVGLALHNFGLDTIVYAACGEETSHRVPYALHRIVRPSTLAVATLPSVLHSDMHPVCITGEPARIRLRELPDIEKCSYLLALPVQHHDFDTHLLDNLPGKISVALAPGGLLRHVEHGRIIKKDPAYARRYIGSSNMLFLSEADLECIANKPGSQDASIEKSVRSLLEDQTEFVAVTQKSGAYSLFTRDKSYGIPAFTPKKIVDASRMDAFFMAGFLAAWMAQKPVAYCGLFASMASTLSMERQGQSRLTYAKVIDRIALSVQKKCVVDSAAVKPVPKIISARVGHRKLLP
jgi:hypothetical protein